jgi:hypothetical protein
MGERKIAFTAPEGNQQTETIQVLLEEVKRLREMQSQQNDQQRHQQKLVMAFLALCMGTLLLVLMKTQKGEAASRSQGPQRPSLLLDTRKVSI